MIIVYCLKTNYLLLHHLAEGVDILVEGDGIEGVVLEERLLNFIEVGHRQLAVTHREGHHRLHRAREGAHHVGELIFQVLYGVVHLVGL